MTRYRLNALPWSVGLMAGGVLLLLFNFGLFAHYAQWTQYGLAVLLALLGVAFGVAFLSARQHWWQLIPSWTLLALAGMLYLNTAWQVGSQQTAPILFLGLACAFAHIYWLNRTERWWAILPGGFMLVLAVVIGISHVMPHLEILFIGMGLVFFLLYLLAGHPRQWWALIPGGILTLFGLFVFAATNGEQVALVRWWPVILILVGLGIGWQGMRRAPSQSLSVNQAPALSRYSKLTGAKLANKGRSPQGAGGEYTRPAPGASVEVLPDRDE